MSEQSGGTPNWLIALALPVGIGVGWAGVNLLTPGEGGTDVQGIATLSAEEQALITAREVAETTAEQVATSIANNVGSIARAEAEKIARGEALQIAEAHVKKRKAELADAKAKMAAETADSGETDESAAESDTETGAAMAAATGVAFLTSQLAADDGSADGENAKMSANDAAESAADEEASEPEAPAAMADNAADDDGSVDEPPAAEPASVEATVRSEMTTEIESAVDNELLAKAKEEAGEAEAKLQALRSAQEEEDKDTAELLAKLQAALADAENAREAAQKELAMLKGNEYQAAPTAEEAAADEPPMAEVSDSDDEAEAEAEPEDVAEAETEEVPAEEAEETMEVEAVDAEEVDAADSDDAEMAEVEELDDEPQMASGTDENGQSFLMKALAAGGADVDDSEEGRLTPTTITLDGQTVSVDDNSEASVNPMQFGDPIDNYAEPPPRNEVEVDAGNDSGLGFFMQALQAGGAENDGPAATTIVLDGEAVAVQDTLAASADPMVFEVEAGAGVEVETAEDDVNVGEYDADDAGFLVEEFDRAADDGRSMSARNTFNADELLEMEGITSSAGSNAELARMRGEDVADTVEDEEVEADVEESAEDEEPEVAEVDADAEEARAEAAAAAAAAAAKAKALSKPFVVSGKSVSAQAAMKSFETLKQHRRPVWGLAFSGNGQTLASGGSERVVKTYNLRSKSAGVTFKGSGGYVSDVAYSPNGKQLAAASGDGAVRIYNAGSGSLLRRLSGSGEVSKIAYTPDSGYIVVGYDSGKINVFGADSGKLYRSLGDYDRAVGGLSVSADGTLLASNELDGGEVTLWNLKTGEEVRSLGSNVEARNLQFAPKGSTLAVGSASGDVTLWNSATGKLAATLKGHDKAVDALAFSGNGKLLATGGPDQTVVLWDVASEKKLKTLTGHNLEVFDIAFAPSGEYLAATGTGRSVKVWSISK